MLFNSKQGLSNSCIHSIYEDTRHNIWIATQNGLNRYDGVKMNVYRHHDNEPSSLMHDDVMKVFEYDRDHILIGTGAGVQMYDYATDKFQTIPLLNDNGDTISVHVVEMFRINEGGKDRIFLGFAGYGNAELVFQNDGSIRCQLVSDFKANDVDYFTIQHLKDKKGRHWFVQIARNVFRLEGKKMKQIRGIRNVCKITESKSGNIYGATIDGSLYKWDSKTDEFVQIASSADIEGAIYGLNPWMDGRLFICTDGGGLRIYDEKTGKVTQSTISINNFDLSTSNVKDAICDTYGNVWVGIYWMGVMMKPHNQTAFDYIGRNSITKNTIGSKSVFTIAKADDSHIWVAPDNDGLYLMSKDGMSSVHVIKDKNSNTPSNFTAIYQTEKSSQSLTNSHLLLGTFMDGLWQMQQGQLSLISKDINHIFEIKPADKGNVWIATVGNGFYYFNTKTHDFIRYTSNWPEGTERRDVISNQYVYTIMQKNDRLYVGTSDGMYICKCDGDGIIREKSKKILRTFAVNHLVFSEDEKYIWAGTNNGLMRIELKTLATKRFSTNDGLANNVVKALNIEDGKYWISTDNGLSLFDPKTEKFTNFFADDGLQDNEFNRGTTMSLGGNMYFGGITGLTYFNAKNIEKRNNKTVQLNLKLVDLIVNNKVKHKGDLSGGYEVMQDVINDCERIDLSHSDNHFVLEVCVEGLSNQHIQYEYSINNGEWANQGGTSSRIVFDNLTAGTYNVKIRAIALGAVSDERTLVVRVHPAWYASWWAKFFYLLLLALVGYLTYIYVHRQVRARKVLARHRQQQEINEARIQFFMNISHEIRTPMTLILAPLERLLGTDKDSERQRSYTLMKQNANRILRLINQMMDVRKIEQGKYQLDYHKVELVSLLQNTFDVFQSKAQSHQIKYEFEHADIVTLPAYVDPENIDKIVMNLLSNAFKFTPDGGKVTMTLSADTSSRGTQPAGFTLSVTDTGCGINDEDKKKVFDRFYSASQKNGYMGTGIGLNLSSMLVKLHKGTIIVQDNPEGKGTRFVVEIPIPQLPNDEVSFLPDEKEEKTEASNPSAIAAPTLQEGSVIRSSLILVEDDASIREYVSAELSRDFKVHEFIDGQKAWDYVVAHPNKVDLIISDIMMPVMDGLTLCQKVKSNFNTNHIPILLMTALGSDADRIVGMTNGADAYISKPFNIDVLESTAVGLLKNRQLLQGRFQGEKIQQAETEKIEIESPDEQFMKRVMKVINENIDNEDLSVEMVADKVGVSRVHFYRKMKDLTGQGPREYMKYVRLKEAARLLATKKMDITGVSIACGFKTISTFSASFKQLYGLTPTEWMRQHEGGKNRS